MPWNIIILPVLFCLFWGFHNGVKIKNKSHDKKS